LKFENSDTGENCYMKRIGFFLKISILGIFGSILIFDLIMVVFAVVEKFSSHDIQNDWVVADQELNPLSQPGKRSVILVHGFVGSPFDYKPLAEELRKEGFRVIAPVSPCQNRTIMAYNRGAYTSEMYIDWLSNIVEQEKELFGKKPYLVGFSMGGALSTIIASRGIVEKLVLIAPFYSLPIANDGIAQAAGLLKYFIPIIPKISKGKINDPSGYDRYMPGSNIISLHAFQKLGELAKSAHNCVEKIDVPVLVVGSPNDRVASFEHTLKLFRSHPNSKIIDFPASDHIILYDYDHNQAVREITGFLLDA